MLEHRLPDAVVGQAGVVVVVAAAVVWLAWKSDKR